MVELKRKDKIEEKNDRFIQKITVTYPKENVKNMIQNWEQALKQAEDWLEHYDENLDKLLKDGVERFTSTLNAEAENYEQFEKLPDDEKFKRFMDEFNKHKQEVQEKLDNIEKYKEELKKEIKSEFEKMKQEQEQRKEMWQQALKLWKNGGKN